MTAARPQAAVAAELEAAAARDERDRAVFAAERDALVQKQLRVSTTSQLPFMACSCTWFADWWLTALTAPQFHSSTPCSAGFGVVLAHMAMPSAAYGCHVSLSVAAGEGGGGARGAGAAGGLHGAGESGR